MRYELRRVAAADEKTPASFAGFNRVLTTVSDKTNTPPQTDAFDFLADDGPKTSERSVNHVANKCRI
ncbi:MAG: hypothetical protein CTY36_07510 [Methylocystis sp.]|nr:MAG: hypothetical protein CTY36_07510 [Methylocystis sp.]